MLYVVLNSVVGKHAAFMGTPPRSCTTSVRLRIVRLLSFMTIFLNGIISFGQLSTLHNFSVETGYVRDSELVADGLYLYGVRSDGGRCSFERE